MGRVSDLQCAARFILVPAPPGPSDAAGTRQAERWRGERPLAVLAVDATRALAAQTAEALGLDHVLLPEPVGLSSLEDVADLHRGETVIVLLPLDQLTSLVTELRLGPVQPGPVRVEIDDDGPRQIMPAAPADTCRPDRPGPA